MPGVQPELDELQRSVLSSSGVSVNLLSAMSASRTLFQSAHFRLNDSFGISRLDNGASETNQDTRMMGLSYGAELLLRRSMTRHLGGIIAYTLSRSERFVGRVEGPSTFDRTHVLNVALTYDLGRRWRLGARLMTYSGIPADVAYLAAARNPPRTEPFWRLDWRLEKRWLIGTDGAWWAFAAEVLNTTLNPEQMEKSCNAYRCQARELGPITLPSLGVEARF